MVSRYPYIDRNPCITPAGKPFGDPCAKVKDCLYDVPLREEVQVLQKQLGLIEPKGYGPERKSVEYPGMFTEIAPCMIGPVKTQFQCLDADIKDSIYDSYWNKSVGKTRDPVPGLPKGMDIYCTTFGKPVKRSMSAGEVVHPRKTPGQVVYEDKICHDLYRYSHQNYYPGEQLDRSYAPPYHICKTFGSRSYVDHSGAKAKRQMTWFNNDNLSNVSRRQAAVRERTSAPIGQTLDRTGVSSMFDYNHTFGKPTGRSFYGVGDLLNDHTPSLLKRDMQEFIAYANKLRRSIHNLINKGDLTLEDVYEQFLNLDEDKSCTLYFDCIYLICKKNSIYFDRSKVEPLLLLLGIMSQDGITHYGKFLDFLDLNKGFPPLKREYYVMPPEYQSYDMEHKSNLPPIPCRCKTYMRQPAGMPSIPVDKKLPYYEGSRVNIDHLGSETTARAIVSPSIYTQYGLSHRDFFKPRSKEFLANLFRKIGCTLSDEDIDEIYAEGLEMDKTKGVCVETFRNLLDVRAFKVYQRLQ